MSIIKKNSALIHTIGLGKMRGRGFGVFGKGDWYTGNGYSDGIICMRNHY